MTEDQRLTCFSEHVVSETSIQDSFYFALIMHHNWSDASLPQGGGDLMISQNKNWLKIFDFPAIGVPFIWISRVLSPFPKL